MKVTPAWLASFRLRLLFRSAFVLLALAVVTMAITALQEEKQRSHDHYQESFTKTKEQIVARLYHPWGQLALLNPPRDTAPATPLDPVVLTAANSVFMTALRIPRDSANRHRSS